jgi:hypothetical protein
MPWSDTSSHINLALAVRGKINSIFAQVTIHPGSWFVLMNHFRPFYFF